MSNGSTIICYQFTCNQNQLVSSSLAIQTFVIKHINSVAITFICYPALTAIDTFAIKLHLLSVQFAINPKLQSTIFLSIIICCQIFDLLSIITLTSFFFLKIRKKMEKFLKIWNSSVYIIYLSLVIIYSNNIFIYCHIFRKNCDSKLFHSLGH